jgi:uncharacterized membrane protein YvlD (DUF360 family)
MLKTLAELVCVALIVAGVAVYSVGTALVVAGVLGVVAIETRA